MSDAAHTHTNGNGQDPLAHGELFKGARTLALLLGVGGLIAFLAIGGILSSIGEAKAPQQFFLSYLTGFFFWFSVGIGAFFFLSLQYFTGGRWGILLRRPFEANTRTLLLGFVLFLPILVSFFMGEKSMYWWAGHGHESHAGEMADKKEKIKGIVEDAAYYRPEIAEIDSAKYLNKDLNQKVERYLNPAFTSARAVGIFLAFGLMVVLLNVYAKKAEKNKDAKARDLLKYIGTVSVFVFALATTVLVTDWVMSLEETFASTMFPVIVFANAMICSYAIGLLTLLSLKQKGHKWFTSYFTAGEQIHLGSFLLAFTLFWTYTNYSQYMLMWIGNLPEEIPFYLKRLRGGWEFIGMFMLVFHFFVPFMLLLFRHVKSNPVALKWICRGLLLVCAVDVFWWIQPSALVYHEKQSCYWLMDIASFIGIGGVWIWYYLGQFAKNPPLPTEEIYLLEAYHHGH
jgi:hypothetical protein